MEEIFKIHFKILESALHGVFGCFLINPLITEKVGFSKVNWQSYISIITAIFECPMTKASSFLWAHFN